VILSRSIDFACDVCERARATVERDSLAAARRVLRTRGWTTRVDGSGSRLDVCPACRGHARAAAKVEAAARERARAAAARLAAIEAEGPEL
jgi:hypothetical protein